MSDRELAEQTQVFRDQLKGGSTLEDILPKAYALVREGAKRVFGKRLFDMQILGGIVLHQGRIAEMKTGEGKTLTAVLAAYLNALTGEGVHVVTVNDYLASFQSESMGLHLPFLGLDGQPRHPGHGSLMKSGRLTSVTLPTAQTTNSVSITCGTTWSSAWISRCSASCITPSSTRWTVS